jgi:hypothetical protein
MLNEFGRSEIRISKPLPLEYLAKSEFVEAVSKWYQCGHF